MHQNGSKKTGLLVIILILLALILKTSFYLRSIGYDKIPETFVILDERTNVWHGLSIRKSGVPAAWSNLGVYKTGTGGDVNGLSLSVADYRMPDLIHFRDFPKPVYVLFPVDLGEGKGIKHIGFVQPYLDHPPFGALVLSSFVTSNIKTFNELTPTDFRRGSLWMGVISGLLIFTLGWQISNNPFVGLLAAAIYGSAPSFVLLSRYALLENVLNPLMLLSINLLVFAQKSLRLRRSVLFAAGVASGLCALTKITGWSVLVIGIILLRYWKLNLKDILFFTIPSAGIGLLYFVWGLYLGPGLFIDIFRYQGLQRGFIGSINLLVTIGRVGILNFPLDGWWIGGFLSFILVPFKKDYLPIFVSILILFFSALFLGGANYPWYFIPLIPFMCLTTALFIWQVATEPKFISIVILFLVFFSSSFYWGYGVYQASLPSTNYQQPFGLYRLLLLSFILIGLVWTKLSGLKHYKLAWFVFLVVVVIILFRLNERSLYFILSHWGKFPSLYTPGTF